MRSAVGWFERSHPRLYLVTLCLVFMCKIQVGVIQQSFRPEFGDVWLRHGDVDLNLAASLLSSFENDDNNNAQKGNEEQDHDVIRKWGCAGRNETPLIYVHIGKTGGGSVRARFAAAALHYRRGKKYWNTNADSVAYYAIPVTSEYHGDHDNNNGNTTSVVLERGYFCNSAFSNFRINPDARTFEGTRPCHALTPLGHAIACPHVIERFDRCYGCTIHDERCHRVYMSHSHLGHELHWLPPRFLWNWWKKQQQQVQQQPTANSQHGRLLQALEWIRPNNSNWCPALQRGRLEANDEMFVYYKNCSLPLARKIDTWAHQWLEEQQTIGHWSGQASRARNRQHLDTQPVEWPSSITQYWHPQHQLINWGPLYASMPVLRTTIVREPFSWLLSKFFWHDHKVHYSCDDVTSATWAPDTWHLVDRDDRARGWAHWTARLFILQLCGEDCQIRWDAATTALGSNFTAQHERVLLNSFERQADYNLRHSFAVVGLNEDIQEFYDMVSARVHYLDMSRNLHVQGMVHRSMATKRCKRIFANVDFQRQLINQSYAIAALVRLYQTAVRVNAQQKQEFSVCSHH